jgi:hypothetical protein
MEAVRSNKADLWKLEQFGFLVRRWDDPDRAVAFTIPGSGDEILLTSLSHF